MATTGRKLRRRIGVLLRRGRDEAALTQGEASRRLRGVVTDRTLREWEQGGGNLKPLHYAVWLARQSEKLRAGLVALMLTDFEKQALQGKVGDALLEAYLDGLTTEDMRRAAIRDAKVSTEHLNREREQVEKNKGRWGVETPGERIQREAEIRELAHGIARGGNPVAGLADLIDPLRWRIRGIKARAAAEQ